MIKSFMINFVKFDAFNKFEAKNEIDYPLRYNQKVIQNLDQSKMQ